jgi:uncharacterized protein (TIGR03790 family)
MGKLHRKAMYRSTCIVASFVLLILGVASPCNALEPGEVLVVANRNATHSIGLAKYYMEKRDIPSGNLVKLRVPDQEVCSRDTYNEQILKPIRKYLRKRDAKRNIRCLLLMYGVPLKVEGPELTEPEKRDLLDARMHREALKLKLHLLDEDNSAGRRKIAAQISRANARLREIRFADNRSASVDSELALARLHTYSLSGWLPNPYCLFYEGKSVGIRKRDVLMVSRLDGPSEKIVRRVIDDSLAAERAGLKGVCYMDARWPIPKENQPFGGYGFYDQSIHRAGQEVKKSGLMPVVIEDTPALFQPGQCPKAALYCGWYSLAHYVNAFQWQRGSVGYHIASSECVTLKIRNSQVWCKRMLEEGIAATIGPVEEPYVDAFPIPEIFFKYLVDGYLTLAECYFVSLPYLSWKMVLVGDPLYTPFKNRHP